MIILMDDDGRWNSLFAQVAIYTPMQNIGLWRAYITIRGLPWENLMCAVWVGAGCYLRLICDVRR